MPDPQPENPSPDGTWATVQADNRGRPLIVRVRTDLAGDHEMHARWPNRMVVVWQFPLEGSEGTHGLPTEEQQAGMNRFEDAVCDALTAAGSAVLTSVATCAGQREWVWYCGESAAFNKAFNAAL